MKTLTSTLLAAQQAASGEPYVRVTVSERLGAATRLRWTRLYTGAEPDSHHAAAMPADGALLRARIDSATAQVMYQRVTAPGPASDFSAWTAMGGAATNGGVALASRGSSVLLAWVASDGLTVTVRESTDGGVTFVAAVSAAIEGSAVDWLAADYRSDGTVLALFYAVGATVKVVARTGGVWGAPSAWSNTASAIRGLACRYSGDWNLTVAGDDATGSARLWVCAYGDGYAQAAGTWSALHEVMAASTGSSVQFRAPSVARPDIFRLGVVEAYSGDVAYSRPLWTHSLPSADLLDNRWREPVPFDLSSSFGMAIASSAGAAWLTTPGGVWTAALAPAPIEVTADVLAIESDLSPRDGTLRVELRNDDGRYAGIGAGSLAAISPGAAVNVGLGYRTSAGVETAAADVFWLEDGEYRSDEGRATLALHARSAWGLLRAMVARRQERWTVGSRSISEMVGEICGRAGLEAVTSGIVSNALTSLKPDFTVHPGDSLAGAVQRLLVMVPEVLFPQGERLVLKQPLAGEASSYAYGGGHALHQGRYRAGPVLPNRVQVYGTGAVAEEFDWTAVGQVYDQLLQVSAPGLSSAADLQDRAARELRVAQRGGTHAEIVVPVNCGQELYDVVTVTDARAGLSSARYRVEGLRVTYQRAPRGRYDMRLRLSGV